MAFIFMLGINQIDVFLVVVAMKHRLAIRDYLSYLSLRRSSVKSFDQDVPSIIRMYKRDRAG